MKIEKVSSWKIKGDLEVGGVIQSQNRGYMLLSANKFVSKGGRPSNLLLWRGDCTVCGASFLFTGIKSNFTPKATCERHRPKRRA